MVHWVASEHPTGDGWRVARQNAYAAEELRIGRPALPVWAGQPCYYGDTVEAVDGSWIATRTALVPRRPDKEVMQ